MYASRPYSTALSMPSAVCVASWAATSRSFGSKAGRSGRRRNTRGADHPAPAAQRGQDRALAARHAGRARAEQLGQRGPGGGGVAEHRPHPAQHLGERPAGPHLAQFGRGRQIGLRVRDAAARPGSRSRCPGPQRKPVGTAQPQHERAGGPLVADRQRVAQIDEDRVGERRHGGPAQPQHDLVQVDAAGDPPGRGPDEPQPVALAPHAWPPGGHALPGTPLRAAGVTARPLGARLRRVASGARRGRCVRAGGRRAASARPVRTAPGRGASVRRAGVPAPGALAAARRRPARAAVPLPGLRASADGGARPWRWDGAPGYAGAPRGGPWGRPAAPGPALVRGAVLRHACRVHPSGAARRVCSRIPSESPIPGMTCPRNGIPAWSEAVPGTRGLARLVA